MRRDDVNGARCRSDGVWMALARDVKKQLDNRTATANDLVSVIVMKEDADAPLILEPIDWVIYNRLVDMTEWSELRPSGPGNYLPMLSRQQSVSCPSNQTALVRSPSCSFAMEDHPIRGISPNAWARLRCQVRSPTNGLLHWHG